MKPLEGFRVAILATHGFEESELVEPRKAVNDVGAQAALLARESGEVQGLNHSERGSRIAVDGASQLFADALKSHHASGTENPSPQRKGASSGR